MAGSWPRIPRRRPPAGEVHRSGLPAPTPRAVDAPEGRLDRDGEPPPQGALGPEQDPQPAPDQRSLGSGQAPEQPFLQVRADPGDPGDPIGGERGDGPLQGSVLGGEAAQQTRQQEHVGADPRLQVEAGDPGGGGSPRIHHHELSPPPSIPQVVGRPRMGLGLARCAGQGIGAHQDHAIRSVEVRDEGGEGGAEHGLRHHEHLAVVQREAAVVLGGAEGPLQGGQPQDGPELVPGGVAAVDPDGLRSVGCRSAGRGSRPPPRGRCPSRWTGRRPGDRGSDRGVAGRAGRSECP